MLETKAETASQHAASAVCPVNSWNEWDPLEEVIVGSLDYATIPPHHVSVTFNADPMSRRLHGFAAGRRYPKFMVDAAQKNLDEFIQILKSQGITVRRPDAYDFQRNTKTPFWRSHGFCIACPRDGFIVAGNDIVETPMGWRSRFFEGYAYRKLFQEYFDQGARWSSAPKPMLLDSLYDEKFQAPKKGEPLRYVINESEVVFDAADFMRCGRDWFVQLSNVTNMQGVRWMQRHLGDEIRIHVLETKCPDPMHIDTTFIPLAPGKVLVNPDYIDPRKLPPMFKNWDVIVAPTPDPIPSKGTLADYALTHANMCSKWIALNVLSLDEKRIVVERCQESMIRLLKEHGFEPIPCNFLYYSPFGGAFHCATLDIRRRGTLQSYF